MMGISKLFYENNAHALAEYKCVHRIFLKLMASVEMSKLDLHIHVYMLFIYAKKQRP
jgi:hypothetical protein